MQKEIVYLYKDREYRVLITYKHIRNIIYRFKDDVFYISAPLLVGEKRIIKGLDKYAAKFIKRDENKCFNDEYFYLYGDKYLLNNSGTLKFNDGSEITYSSKEDLFNKLKPFFLKTVTNRTIYYASQMGLETYKVKTRDMETRFGSNSKHTKTICYTNKLMHYSFDIIDSVVVHELAHIKVFNHSKSFYDLVLKYCPDYKACRKKLLKRIYK